MWCIPKKFLCKFPLCLGAFIVGMIMMITLIIIAVATVLQVIYIKSCTSCTPFAWRNCYGFSITGFIYVIVMIVANLWFLWGVQSKKPSVVLSWIVISSMWLTLTIFLLINLIVLHYYDTENITVAAISLSFGIICIALFVYGLLVIIGFWMELKGSKDQPAAA